LALLHATCRQAADLGLQVLALHVHHGLMPEADDWVQRCQRRCQSWRRQGWPLRFQWARLTGAPAQGDSVEAWARAGRYQALADMARQAGAGLILLGQHRRDQAETVLLQALRGAGPAGLSGMPRLIERDGLVWARPWLDCPREVIDAYVLQHRLRPIEDPSNAATRFARNRLRAQLMPALLHSFPDAETSLSQVARRAQEAAAALAELAQMDLAGLVDAQGRLAWGAWRALSAPRRTNALRAWWRGQTGMGPPQAFVDRVLAHEASSATVARWPVSAQWACERYRGRLRAVALQPAPACAPALTIDLSRPGRWPVPAWGGAFEVQPVSSGGLPASRLAQASLRVREGGEQFQFARRSVPRSLKKQFQARAVPASGRDGPLVWQGEQLLWVAGLGVDARALADEGEPQLQLVWQPDAGLSGPGQRPG